MSPKKTLKSIFDKAQGTWLPQSLCAIFSSTAPSRGLFSFVEEVQWKHEKLPLSARVGTPGLDVFKIAGKSVSGFFPSFKTGDPRSIRVPYASLQEQHLALYLEYHPHVRSYQRGDMSAAFADARHIFTPLGTPYRIGYVYEGKPDDDLPHYVGTLSDGGLLIAEAGLEVEKSKSQPLAKAEAARRLAQLKGGVYWIGTDKNLLNSVPTICCTCMH